MAQTDTIGDFLTCVRNASRAKKSTLECPASKMRKNLCEILKREGFIRDFRSMKDERQGVLRIYLKYSKTREKVPAITNLRRISKPGVRRYQGVDGLPSVLGGRGIAILSTSKGVLTDNQCRELKMGGEILCYVW